jgi:DNA-binding FadR family transcriptional regulator
MDPEEFRNLNHRFHMKIGECCANPLLEELYGRVLKAVFDSSAFSSLLYGGLEPEEVKKIVEQVARKHKEIAKAIFEGDPIAASAAAADHVAEIEDQIFEKLV